MALTEKQKEVIDKMKNGWCITEDVEGYVDLTPQGELGLKLSCIPLKKSTLTSLLLKKLICKRHHWRGMTYYVLSRGEMLDLSRDEAIEKACEKASLEGALAFICRWEYERLLDSKNPVSFFKKRIVVVMSKYKKENKI